MVGCLVSSSFYFASPFYILYILYKCKERTWLYYRILSCSRDRLLHLRFCFLSCEATYQLQESNQEVKKHFLWEDFVVCEIQVNNLSFVTWKHWSIIFESPFIHIDTDVYVTWGNPFEKDCPKKEERKKTSDTGRRKCDLCSFQLWCERQCAWTCTLGLGGGLWTRRWPMLKVNKDNVSETTSQLGLQHVQVRDVSHR